MSGCTTGEKAGADAPPYPLRFCNGSAGRESCRPIGESKQRSWEAMEGAVARASVTSSAGLRLPSPRRYTPSSSTRHLRRRRRRSVSCAVEDGDGRLFDAAKLTVDKFVKSGMVVGLGSGLASGLAIQYLGTRLKRGALSDIVGIPSSIFSASEASKAGIPVENYQENTKIDFAFNDADIIEEGTLTALIGRRRSESVESFMEEKCIAKSAGKVAFIVGHDKYAKGIEGSVPVLVKSGNWMDTAEEIDDLFLGDAEVWRRPTFGTASPMGGDFPLVTKDGHHILDVVFTSPIPDLGEVAESLEKISGVVDHGIIFSTSCYAVIASKEQVQILDEESSMAW